MVFKEMVIKNIKEVTELLKEEILKGDVHTIDEMRAWLKPLGYSDTIRVLHQPSAIIYQPSLMDMIVELFRPQLEHQTSYFSHQPSLRLYHHRNLIGSPSAFPLALSK